MPLKIGQKAPDFTLTSTSGTNFTLFEKNINKGCVLYFYPKDFTNVCTKEACEFRDQFEDFRKLEMEVIGISRDDIATHLRFKNQYKLPFELLSDTDGKVCKLYDALVPLIKVPKRVTYLIDNQYLIKAVYEDMFSSEHAGQILKLL